MRGSTNMTTFETFTHKGKEYKFRVGRPAPEVKPMVRHSSNYYKEKQTSLSWALWLTFIPVIILGILYFVYVGSDDPKGFISWFPLLALPYGMLIYAVHDRIQEADKTLSDLQKHAEEQEYLDAYDAWIQARQK